MYRWPCPVVGCRGVAQVTATDSGYDHILPLFGDISATFVKVQITVFGAITHLAHYFDSTNLKTPE